MSTPPRPLQIPEPPEGVTWKYARIGDELAATPAGKEFIERMEKQGILVEILEHGGQAGLFQPDIPPDAKIRSLFKEQDK